MYLKDRGFLKRVPLLLLILLAVISWNRWHAHGQGPDSKAQSKQATANRPAPGQARSPFLTVGASDIDHTILITGELRAEKSRDLTVPRIRSGFASAVTYMTLEGTQVKQGERVLEFDASALLSLQSEAERRLDEAKLRIEKTKADLEAQRSDLLAALATADANLKVAQLYGKIPKELQPANTYQKYQLDLEKAVLARDKAREKLKNLNDTYAAQMALVEVDKSQAEIDLKKIRGDIDKLQVDAPQDGIVIYGDNWASNRKIQIGDNLFPGMTVITLPDLSTMQVVGFIYDTEFRFLSRGMDCDLRLDAVPGKMWRGKILSLTSVASRKGFASQHKVFRAVIQPEAIDLDVMKPGMTVRAEIRVSLASKVIAIPREFLGVDAKGRYYVLKGSDDRRVAEQFVSVGVFSDRNVQITSGLAIGDQIMEIRRRGEAKL